jgi:hypothetical protein
MESAFDDMDEDDTQTKILNCMNGTGTKLTLLETAVPALGNPHSAER